MNNGFKKFYRVLWKWFEMFWLIGNKLEQSQQLQKVKNYVSMRFTIEIRSSQIEIRSSQCKSHYNQILRILTICKT